MEEHLLYTQTAGGSNPSASTMRAGPGPGAQTGQKTSCGRPSLRPYGHRGLRAAGVVQHQEHLARIGEGVDADAIGAQVYLVPHDADRQVSTFSAWGCSSTW